MQVERNMKVYLVVSEDQMLLMWGLHHIINPWHDTALVLALADTDISISTSSCSDEEMLTTHTQELNHTTSTGEQWNVSRPTPTKWTRNIYIFSYFPSCSPELTSSTHRVLQLFQHLNHLVQSDTTYCWHTVLINLLYTHVNNNSFFW